ncbi:MAG: hypothetical protein OJF49_000712 [Ktedonobacterales bacterium]|jgi:pimeloyl-ACP methyl ester carboxylesterase|nr:MAG: hypothetical protein OJF49_000712 [Ktedonobacterales bacterium]
MSQESSTTSDNPQPASAPAPHIAERGVVVNGLRLASAMNDAPRAFMTRVPLVVLPSAGFVWRDYEPILAHFATERRAFALDWPGFGASAKPSPSDFAYDVGNLGDIFSGWLDGMGIARAVLLGNGIGAAIAFAYAQQHPKRVLGLALVSPAGFSRPDLTSQLVSRAAASPGLLRRLHPLATSLLLGPTNDAVESVLERHRALRAASDAAASTAALAALWRSLRTSAPDLLATAGEMTAATVVIRGALDPLVTAADARRTAEAIGSHGALEVTLPNAGHLPFLQEPQRFYAALAGLLGTAELRAAELS